jgi:hypothetical protein
MWLALALVGAVGFVFLFDTGSLAEWIATHKDTDVDEIVVAGTILLVGLAFFSIRPRFELSRQIVKYLELHRQMTALNREAMLLAAMSDLLQSCLTPGEAYASITQTAQGMFPGTSGYVGITSIRAIWWKWLRDGDSPR